MMRMGLTRRTALLLAAAACAAAACAAAWCAGNDDGEKAPLYETVRRASVFVLVDGRHVGSGFFADGEGLVVTASHMVRDRRGRIEVVSREAGRLPARRVAVDWGHDLALLAVPKRDRPYPTLPIADRLPPEGQDVWLFGDPLFRHDLLLKGAVARTEDSYCYLDTLACYARVFYLSAPSPPGTSGGCWVDSRGRVIGVQSGYLNVDKPATPGGIAFSAPPDAIRRLVATRASPAVPTLGARLDELWTQPVGFIARFAKGTEGVATVVPAPRGPAAKAGLNKESLITAADGRAVSYRDELMGIIRAKKPGDQVTLTVLDPDGKPPRKVKVRLGKVAPEQAAGGR